MVKPYTYFDPSGARDINDFLQITRIGLWQALNSYNEEGRSSLLTWIRMRMNQLLIKEIKRMVREPSYTKVSIDEVSERESDRRTIEEKFYEKFANRPFTEVDEEIYYTIIQRVEENLGVNRMVVKVFQLKMVFPGMKRNTLADLVGTTKVTIGKYFQIIRDEIERVSKIYVY